jgi:hypothetical protein
MIFITGDEGALARIAKRVCVLEASLMTLVVVFEASISVRLQPLLLHSELFSAVNLRVWLQTTRNQSTIYRVSIEYSFPVGKILLLLAVGVLL